MCYHYANLSWEGGKCAPNIPAKSLSILLLGEAFCFLCYALLFQIQPMFNLGKKHFFLSNLGFSSASPPVSNPPPNGGNSFTQMGIRHGGGEMSRFTNFEHHFFCELKTPQMLHPPVIFFCDFVFHNPRDKGRVGWTRKGRACPSNHPTPSFSKLVCFFPSLPSPILPTSLSLPSDSSFGSRSDPQTSQLGWGTFRGTYLRHLPAIPFFSRTMSLSRNINGSNIIDVGMFTVAASALLYRTRFVSAARFFLRTYPTKDFPSLRTSEVEKLRWLLQDGDRSVLMPVVVHGPKGIGKSTAIATALGNRGGVLHVPVKYGMESSEILAQAISSPKVCSEWNTPVLVSISFLGAKTEMLKGKIWPLVFSKITWR